MSPVSNGFRCRRCDGTIQEAALGEGLMVEGEIYDIWMCKEFLLS